MAVAAVLPYAMAAVGAAAAYSGVQSQKAQIEAQNKQIQMNNEAALEQMQDNYSQLNVEESKARAESIDQSLAVQKEAIAAESRVNLLSAASGMQGVSVEDMFTTVKQQKGQSLSNVLGNFEDRQYEIDMQAENVWSQTKASRQAKLKKPSGWNQAMQVGIGGLKGYAMGSGLAAGFSAAAPATTGGTGFFGSFFKQQAAPIVKMGI